MTLPMMTRSITTRVQEFYSRHPYPHVSSLRRLDQPDFLRGRLNYALGRTGARELPRRMRIWVPGAGTTLGVQTALHFPAADVLATDLSAASLAITGRLAAELGVTNLVTRVENLLDADYRNQFDYVDCAGVLNHVEDPARGWKALARSLRPAGVASIFIYNAEHRWPSDVWQSCLSLLTGGAEHLATRWQVAAALARDVRRSSMIPTIRDAVAGLDPALCPEDFGDTLVHPHEVSYSLKEMFDLVNTAGLRFAGWRLPEEWDIATYLVSPDLRRRAARLDPERRFELVWTLAGRDSPYFDFYVEKPGREERARRPLSAAVRLQRLSGVTYLNVRRNRVHSRWHLPAIRQTAKGLAVLRNEDSRHKSETWVPISASEHRLLMACDGSTRLGDLLPAHARARADARGFLTRMLAPGHGVLAPA